MPALLRRGVGCDFAFDVLDRAHWMSRELAANSYGKAVPSSPATRCIGTRSSRDFGMNTRPGDALDLACVSELADLRTIRCGSDAYQSAFG